jgi:hypothetical protein
MSDSFIKAYTNLEERFKRQVEIDKKSSNNNNIFYLPAFFWDKAKVDYIFIGMEPSLNWAKTEEDAQRKKRQGFVMCLSTFEDFVFQYAIRQYLCNEGENYCVTDLAKGAMTVKLAGEKRTQRYQDWYSLLLDEIRLIAKPTTKIISLGYKHVHPFLIKNKFYKITGKNPYPVIHYSGQAGQARKNYIYGKEDMFKIFKSSQMVSNQDIFELDELIIKHKNIDFALANDIRKGLANKNLTESRKSLLFYYKNTFENLKKE